MRWVLFSELIARLFGLLRAVITPHYLGPAQYGVLGSISALGLYSAFCDLGALKENEIVQSHQLSTSKHYDSQQTTHAFVLLFFRAFFLGTFISALATHYSSNLSVFFPLLIWVPLVVLQSFGIQILRLRQQKRQISFFVLVEASLLTAGTALIAPKWGVIGLLWLQAVLISAMTCCTWAYIRWFFFSNEPILNLFQWPSWTETLKPSHFSLWLLLGQLPLVILLSMDRLFLASRITHQELGWWTLGAVPLAFTSVLANTAGGYRFIQWRQGSTRFFTPFAGIAVITFGIISWSAFAVFVSWFLPQYYPGLPWSALWYMSGLGVALLFFYDSYRRATLKQTLSVAAKKWTIHKWIAFLWAVIPSIPLCVFVPAFRHEARWWVVIFLNAYLFILWWLERRKLELLFQGVCLITGLVLFIGFRTLFLHGSLR